MRVLPSFGRFHGPAWTDCTNIYVSPWWWFVLDEGERNFILSHERAHCQGNSISEEEADRIGIQNHIQQGGSLQDALSALSHFKFTENRRQAMSNLSLGNLGLETNWWTMPSGDDYEAPMPETSNSDGWDADNWTDIIKAGLGIIPEVVDAAQQGPIYQPMPRPQSQTASKKGILIVAGIVILVIGAIFLLKK